MNFLFRVLRRFWFSLFGFNKFFFCIESVLFFFCCIQTKRSHSWESATPTIPNESYQNPLHPPSIYRLPCRPTYNKCWGASTCEKPKLRKNRPSPYMALSWKNVMFYIWFYVLFRRGRNINWHQMCSVWFRKTMNGWNFPQLKNIKITKMLILKLLQRLCPWNPHTIA